MNPNVFREYDIRGVADRDFGDASVLQLGRCLGTFYSRRGLRRIGVGRDCRLSSPRIHAALCRGLLETGMHLVDVGVGPTPLLYFAVHARRLDGGVQITGSHNPPAENGFKMMVGRSSLFGEDIRELHSLVESGDYDSHPGGSSQQLDVQPDYVRYVREDIDLARTNIRFAIDAGNGAGGPLALRATRALRLDPIALLCELDGSFPVHHPDPTDPETLELLRDRVVSEGLELGFALDGDGDRLGVIDARGDIVWGDRLMIVLSRALLSQHPGAKIIGEVKCSQVMYDDIASHGGRGILWKTGHSLIKTKMKEENALLAGEMSGHLFLADRYYGFDDAIYAALRILEIVASSEVPLHELLADVPKTYSTPEIRVPCDDEKKFEVVARVTEHYRGTHELIDIDGARINFGDGWGLVRASNTQPVLVMRFEATNQPRLRAIREEVEGVLRSVGGAV